MNDMKILKTKFRDLKNRYSKAKKEYDNAQNTMNQINIEMSIVLLDMIKIEPNNSYWKQQI